MSERNKNFQLNTRQKDWLLYGSLVLLALAAFLLIGSKVPVLFDDSGSYMRIKRVEGVMPLYPLFLLANQYLFGMDRYLGAVVVEQGVLAAACVTVFVRTIREEFDLRCWETYLIFFLSLLPFTTELPQSMATQQILTEGLSYALFYLFAVVLLKAIWLKKYTWFAGSLGMTLILVLLRSQLQILFAVCGVIFIYLVCRRRGRGGKARIWLRAAFGAAGGICICLVGVLAASRAVSIYTNAIIKNEKFSLFAMKVQAPEEYEAYLAGMADADENKDEDTEARTADGEAGEPSVEELANRPCTTSQYVSLIFSRGMYEADREDVQLFEDEVVGGLYEALYEAADAEKQRYAYARSGLWMWQDIVGGIGQVGKTCFRVPSLYYAEYYPEIILSDQFSEIRNAHLTAIGLALLRAHFGRFLYHTLMMLPQAFICTVFFQIKPIYLLCHLVTLFLYLSALVLMIWGFADRRAEHKAAELMAAVLGSNVVMVVVISLAFFGQQRYLVYYFGTFYIAYFLLLRELWNCRIRDKASERFGRGKSA